MDEETADTVQLQKKCSVEDPGLSVRLPVFLANISENSIYWVRREKRCGQDGT